jgi:hypothetical protein
MGRKAGSHRARYALYKGEDFLGIGTAEQLAERLGVTIKTIRWYASPACKRRDSKGNHLVAERI